MSNWNDQEPPAPKAPEPEISRLATATYAETRQQGQSHSYAWVMAHRAAIGRGATLPEAGHYADGARATWLHEHEQQGRQLDLRDANRAVIPIEVRDTGGNIVGQGTVTISFDWQASPEAPEGKGTDAAADD
jgi:hypothetical protein